MKKSARILLWVLFIIYCALMIWLLFIRNREPRVSGLPYWENLKANMNLIPFATIKLFYNSLSFMPGAAIVNLLGNVVVIIPLGIFLPVLWKNQRRLWVFLLTVIFVICLVEITQLFTLLGACDIDDLMLNLFGALIGFCLFQIPPIKRALT